MGEGVNEFRCAGQFSCFDNFFMGGVGHGNLDVFFNGAGEQHAVLQHYANLASEPGWFYLGNVHTVDADSAGIRDIKLLYQLGHSAFAGAGASHYAHPQSGRNAKIYIIQYPASVLAVGERY